MVWWQALVLAIVPAALTAGALLLQSALTRRHETARYWSDARFKAYAALWRSCHHLGIALQEQADAARDTAADDRLTVTLRADPETIRPLQQQMGEAWLVSGDKTRDSLLKLQDVCARILHLHRREDTAGAIVRLDEEFDEAFDDFMTLCRKELDLRG